jgi:hypothetical protein
LTGLKSFILNEEIKVSHAERYLGFLDKYHSQVFHDLKQQLEKNWAAEVAELKKKHPLSAESVQDATFRNPKATTELKLVTSSERLTTSRARGPLEVSPSVKVPFVYTTPERHLLTGKLLGSAKEAMNLLAAGWKEIFNFEHKGKLQPWFKIVQDSDEIRFQLSLGTGQSESFKTLYAVRVEYGKTGSKLKDFDRLYLTTLI